MAESKRSGFFVFVSFSFDLEGNTRKTSPTAKEWEEIIIHTN